MRVVAVNISFSSIGSKKTAGGVIHQNNLKIKNCIGSRLIVKTKVVHQVNFLLYKIF